MVKLLAALLLAVPAATVHAEEADPCQKCHRLVSAAIVTDWEFSAHADAGVGCADCHGGDHRGSGDTALVHTITAATCGGCHPARLEQFGRGKHAAAWAAYEAMPTTHALPLAPGPGMQPCAGCHKIGLKDIEHVDDLKNQGSLFGHASCDACHTRHTFSAVEARQPQACRTCHTGFDHPQWEMWSGSKHGVRYLLKQSGTLPETTPAPTCQDCHMIEGDHEVRTGWGFFGVRLPLPDDEQWKADQLTILQALGLLDREAKPTARLDVLKAVDALRLTREDFDLQRERILRVCSDCHSRNFVKAELAKGDDMIREADHLLAEAIRVIAGLYEDGILVCEEGDSHPFLDLLEFQDAPTPIERRLYEMHFEHRRRAFQGAFHANPDYAFRYGWGEMVRDLSEIRGMAALMRRDAGAN